MNLSYKDSGVDIDAGNSLVERIKPLAKSTARLGAMSAIGGFGAVFDIKAAGYIDPLIISTTDGVGTKLKLAFDTGIHDYVGIDLVAMCVNDLVVQGAEPLFFLDYFACGKLNVDVAAKVVAGIAEGCKLAGCALTGGETAEMPGMYDDGEYDLAGFAVGAVERNRLLPSNDIKAKDVVIGIESSGVHSNGYSLVRKIIEKSGVNLESKASFDSSLSYAEAFMKPTRIYVKGALELAKAGLVKGFAHITGGGLLENIPRVLPEGLGVNINSGSVQFPAIFEWLQKAGNVETNEMYRTFNCGIGMAIIAKEENADKIINILKKLGDNAKIIGEVVTINGDHTHRVQVTG